MSERVVERYSINKINLERIIKVKVEFQKWDKIYLLTAHFSSLFYVKSKN